MWKEPLSVRLRESFRVFPVLFQGPACPIRESVRPFRGVARASKFLFEGVFERLCTPIGALQTCTGRSESGTAPAIEVSQKRETLLPGSRNARPTAKHCKNRHFGRFRAKTLDPPTPSRKRAPGLIRRSAERPRLGRPAGIPFSGVSASLNC